MTLQFNVKIEHNWKQFQQLHKNLTRKFLLESGSIVKGEAQQSLADGKKTGKIVKKPNSNVKHQRSAPGEAPATDTGRLVSGLSVEMHADGEGVDIASNAKYSAALEFGTSRMRARPFMVPALENSRRKIGEIFKKIFNNIGGGKR